MPTTTLQLKIKAFPWFSFHWQDALFKGRILFFFHCARITSRGNFFFPRADGQRRLLEIPSAVFARRKGFVTELILFGLNFSAKRLKYYKPPFFLDLHKSHRIIFAQQRLDTINSRVFKRHLVLFSYSSSLLRSLIHKIQKYQPANAYSAHGVLARGDVVKRKPGKVRQK